MSCYGIDPHIAVQQTTKRKRELDDHRGHNTVLAYCFYDTDNFERTGNKMHMPDYV